MLYETVVEKLKNSSYTVVLSGNGQIVENGYPVLRDGYSTYDNETKYGYSGEEIFSSAMYSTRKELFYRYYREELLDALSIPPGKGFTCLGELEQMNAVDYVITSRIFGLPERGGCSRVINLHGSVYQNYCPHCGKEYSVEYIKESPKIPLCENCGTPIRPRVSLFGEMVDNGIMTRAAETIQKAELLLVLGANLNSPLCQLVDYFEGRELILVNQEEHYSDQYASLAVHSRSDEFLENLVNCIRTEYPQGVLPRKERQ